MAGTVFLGCPLLRAIAYALKLQYGNGYTWLVADGLAAGALLALFCRQPGRERKSVLRVLLLCIGAAHGHFGLMVVRFTTAAGIAVAIAAASRHTLEARFLGLKDRWAAGATEPRTNCEQFAEEKRQIA